MIFVPLSFLLTFLFVGFIFVSFSLSLTPIAECSIANYSTKILT
jgi:hypothetical protein